MHIHAMDGARAAKRTLMACLGEASRFNLVRLLIAGPRCVTELAAEVGLSQSCTTRHLQALARRRIVAARRDGKRVLYRLRLEEPGLDPLLAWALTTRPAPKAPLPSPSFRARPVPRGGRIGPASSELPTAARPGTPSVLSAPAHATAGPEVAVMDPPRDPPGEPPEPPLQPSRKSLGESPGTAGGQPFPRPSGNPAPDAEAGPVSRPRRVDLEDYLL